MRANVRSSTNHQFIISWKTKVPLLWYNWLWIIILHVCDWANWACETKNHIHSSYSQMLENHQYYSSVWNRYMYNYISFINLSSNFQFWVCKIIHYGSLKRSIIKYFNFDHNYYRASGFTFKTNWIKCFQRFVGVGPRTEQ